MMQLADTDQEAQVRLAAFREELQKLGWRIGKNLQIDYRFGISNDERAQTAVVELLNLAPDLIFANSSVPLRAAKAATDTVPIVFSDRSGRSGLRSESGASRRQHHRLLISESSVGGKWLDRLKEVVPNVTHVALMFDPQRATYGANISRFAAEAAERHAVRYLAAPVNEAAEIETVMSALAGEPNGGLILSPDAFTVTHGQEIIGMATRGRLPTIFAERNFAAAGGLILRCGLHRTLPAGGKLCRSDLAG